MPVKSKLSLPATKRDIDKLDSKIDGVEKRLDAKIDGVEKNLNTKIEKLSMNMGGKLDRIQNTLDGFVGRVDDLTVENQVGTNQTRELQEQVEGHEKRIKILESSSAH